MRGVAKHAAATPATTCFGRVSTTDAFPDACASWSTCSRSSTAHGSPTTCGGSDGPSCARTVWATPSPPFRAWVHRYLPTTPGGRELQIRLASESACVGLSLGYRVPPFGGFEAETWANVSDGSIYEEIDNSISSRVGGDDWKPSMAQDAHKGRPTEIDEMNGYVLARAGEAGETCACHGSDYRCGPPVRARGDRSGRCSPGPHSRNGGVLITGLSRPAPRRIRTVPSIGKCQPGTVTDGSVVAATQVQSPA